MFQKLTSFFVGEAASSSEDKHEWLFNTFILFFLGNLVVYINLSLTNTERLAHWVTLLGLSLVYLAFRITRSYRYCSHAMIALNYAHIYFVALLTGGIHSSALSWFAFLPTAALMLGRKSAVYWLWVSITLLTSLALVNYSFSEIQDFRLRKEDALWSTAMQITITTGILFTLWIYDVMNQQRRFKLNQKTQELEQKHDELLRAQALKDEFIASVGHELRTPMNAILGFNELLSLEVQSKKAKEIVQNIQSSAKQLLKVISDILDYSQLMAGKLNLLVKEHSVRTLLEQAVVRARHQAQGKPLEIILNITPSTPESCSVDVVRISQVLDHLLSNAMKFMAAGRIEIFSSATKDRLRIEIKDSGIGISPEKQQYIFNRFAHANSEVNRRYGGTGLGLAICEQLIQLHKGLIGVNSALGRGSTFWFELPLDESASLCPITQSTYPSFQIPERYTHTPWPLPYLGQTVQDIYLRFLNRLDAQVPEKIRGPKLEAKVGLLFTASILAPIYVILSTCPELIFIHCVYPLLYVVGLWLITKGVKSVAVMQGMIGLTYVYVAAATIYSGGSHSVISSWIILIPLPAFDLLGRRFATIWLLAGLIIYAGINFLTQQGLTPYAWESTPQTIMFYWFSYVHITALVLYLPMHYKSIHAKIRKDLELHNASLEQTQKALLEEQKQKDEFISTVSHEFRTPMNAIIGFNHLLADEISQEPQALQLQSHVTQSAEHLLTVIDDILDYSQLRTGNLNIRYETFSLPQVLLNVNSLFLSKGQSKEVTFSLKSNAIPEWVVGDKHRLTQILINLVGNALKFTEKGFVELRALPYESGILFEIEDSGIGISPEKISLIFNQYEQVHAQATSRYAGHGLGLAISKRLIELQNGTIKANSQPGKGSLFTVWLPYRECDSPQEPARPLRSRVNIAEKLKILVVDDHPLNRLLATQMLQKNWPMAVIDEAEDGFKTLQKLRLDAFDIIIMDMVMPEMDGIEATRIIREAFESPKNQIPIIGLTANINPIEREKCLQAGMNDIIYKPFQMEELVTTIEKVTVTIDITNSSLAA